MTFKDRLFELMSETNTWNASISRETGISKARLSGFISGTFKPSCVNLIKLADHFNVSIDFLLGVSDIKKYGIYRTADAGSFVKNYVKLLKDKHISNRKFSSSIGINKSNLFLWQKGSLPHAETLVKMSHEFGVSIDELLGRRITNE